jgi:hypothetical protein
MSEAESSLRADRLRALQASNRRQLAERGISIEDLPDLVRQALVQGPQKHMT